MRWRDVYEGAVVYHVTFVSWGRGVVQHIRAATPLELIFIPRKKYVVVKFEHNECLVEAQASQLRTTPNRKKIRKMIAYYATRDKVAADGGDRLILPSEVQGANHA
jgi:ribosomal protein S17E